MEKLCFPTLKNCWVKVPDLWLQKTGELKHAQVITQSSQVMAIGWWDIIKSSSGSVENCHIKEIQTIR